MKAEILTVSLPESAAHSESRICVPVRVIGFNENRARFIEDTRVTVVSPTGGLLALEQTVFPGDPIHVINLEGKLEAGFRVVGPSLIEGPRVDEWGVECNEKASNIWGARIHELLRESASEERIALQCLGCKKEMMRVATVVEQRILEASGLIALDCPTCRKANYWSYAEARRRPECLFLAAEIAPAPRTSPIQERIERRASKRSSLSMTAMVCDSRGRQEIAETIGISKAGATIPLVMDLKVGDIVKVTCPYTPRGHNLEQRAEVRWSDASPNGKKRYYGLHFLRSSS